MAAEPTHLALFDLDHTLLDGDSNTLWLEFLVERGHLPESTRQQQHNYMARYAAEQLDIEDYLAFHLRLLMARPLAEWLPLRDAFVAECVAPRIGIAARQTIARHRTLGHRLAIITATHDFLSTAIAQLVDVPVIAPRGELRDGHLTGRIVGLACFRERKLDCLRNWLQEQGLDDHTIGERHFYTDSANDLPLLEMSSHPVAVNADVRLTALAEQRGWPTLRWRRR
jgi:HAD superfamily hydrolase (TIGR01490 family)